MKSLKFKSLILFFVLTILLISIYLFNKKTYMNKGEVILKKFSKISKYKSDVDYVIKNVRGEKIISTTQYYDNSIGKHIKFENGRIQIYKDNYIYVKENIKDNIYKLDNKMDNFYSMSFIDKISKLFINNNDFKYYNIEKEGMQCLAVEFKVITDNKNINKGILYLDKKNCIPLNFIIYNDGGDEAIRIIYKNFTILEEIDKNLFEINDLR